MFFNGVTFDDLTGVKNGLLSVDEPLYPVDLNDNPPRLPSIAPCNCLTGTPHVDVDGVCTCIPSAADTVAKPEIANYTKRVIEGKQYFYFNGKWYLDEIAYPSATGETGGIKPIKGVPIGNPAPVATGENLLFGFTMTQVVMAAAAGGGLFYMMSGKRGK